MQLCCILKYAPHDKLARMKLAAIDRRFCVAPMLDCTDRHERYLARLISKHAVLYTEMITTGGTATGWQRA